MTVLTLDELARPSGAFLLVAADQRASLRALLEERGGAPVLDERLAELKAAVACELSPWASGLLVDPGHGSPERLVGEELVAEGCGLVLAVDTLRLEPGEPVEETALDPGVRIADAASLGVVALKLLLVWRDDERRWERHELARALVRLAAEHGLLSLLAVVVRGPAGFDEEAAIVEAARELGLLRPSLYACQVPLDGRGSPEAITAWCRQIDAVLPCPWVVLSRDVEPRALALAVEAACRGGASGALAGLAVWAAALDGGDPIRPLREDAVPRLRELGDVVDRHGRPWREKLGA